MSQPTLLLVHGWGLGGGVWRKLLKRLDNPPHLALDFGFYGKPKLAIPTDRPLIAVGHSLGFLWILRQLSQNAPWGEQVAGLISVNGFCRFAQGEDFSQGVHPHLLRRMKSGLRRDPIRVLADFRALGGLSSDNFLSDAAKQRLDPNALAQGLEWLGAWDGRQVIRHWKKPILVLANRDDEIVTPQITEASFAPLFGNQTDQIHWLTGGGHLGLLSHMDPIEAEIKHFYTRWG
ncbi:MAG: alpha/beta hydrolase [Magnetococcales bacterium]|nr:alpha/beta hydrolase [Magnetococcales bacterium]